MKELWAELQPVYQYTQNISLFSGSRPGSTDGEGYHPGQGIQGAEMGGMPTVGPRIRALQHQLKLADINDAKGRLV